MTNPFVKLHIAIILAGFTGIFGKLIHLAEGPLVWWRTLMTTVLFAAYLYWHGDMPRVRPRDALVLGGIGAILAAHWLFFYGSIKYANVSIAVVCFASVGFFTAVLDPLFKKRLPSPRELCFSLLTILGIALIFHFDTQYRTGIILGLLSALTGSLFSLSIRAVGDKFSSSTILLFQMAGGVVFLTLIAPAYITIFPGLELIPGKMDVLYLFLLSSVCGIGLFWLQIQALQEIPAFTVNLSFNLEPIYSIALAMLLLGEAKDLGISFFVGLVLIAASVGLQTLYALRQTRAIRARSAGQADDE